MQGSFKTEVCLGNKEGWRINMVKVILKHRNTLDVKCPKCGTTENLTGLAAWSAIILGAKCPNCGILFKIDEGENRSLLRE